MTSDIEKNRRTLQIWFIVGVWSLLVLLLIGAGVDRFMRHREAQRAQDAKAQMEAFIERDDRFANVDCFLTTGNNLWIKGSIDPGNALARLIDEIDTVLRESGVHRINIELRNSARDPKEAEDYFIASFPRDLDAWREWLAEEDGD